MSCFQTLDWKFIVGDVLIPVITFIVGLFVGKGIEMKKAKSKIKGSNNLVIQNSEIKSEKEV